METRDYLSTILYTQEEILERIKTLGKEITQYYKDKNVDNLLVVPIMDGSLVFASLLLLELDILLHVRSTKVTSYNTETESSKDPKLLIHVPMDLVKNKNILIVEDLIDTGLTLSMFSNYLKEMGAADIKICVLFNKDVKNRNKEVHIDFEGFKTPDEWVAGFGIDSQGYFRNLKDFGVVNPKYIKKK